MRHLVLFLITLALLCAAGCSSFLTEGAGGVPLDRYASGFNPQAPTIVIPTVSDGLKRASWISAAGVEVTALDALNQFDGATLGKLRVTGSPAAVTISATGPIVDAGLYVRYDSAKLRFLSADASRTDGLGIVSRIDKGIIGIGLTGINGRLLSKRLPLAQLTFAPGADTALPRRVNVANIPRNAVGEKEGIEDDLVVVDNVNSTGTLSWLERNNGDYDLNGLVTINDISKIGAHLGHSVIDGDHDPIDEPVDGDENGLITIAELTPLGASLGSTIFGYNVYRTPVVGDEIPDPADTGRWTKVDNTANPSGPSAPRETVPGEQTRLHYTFLDNSSDGKFAWYVAAVSIPTDTNQDFGPASNVAIQTITPAGPPPAGLSFEVGTPLHNVDDEFYLAVKVTGVSDLFSANVRFEYDGSIVQFIEGVAAYDDGTNHPNMLEPPLFVSVDDVDSADDPYVLLGFNATQTQGTPTKSGDGYLGYFKFKAIAPGIVNEAFRFPQSSNFIYLWGETYGEAVAAPALGSPQLLNIAP